MKIESSKDKIESLRELINTLIISENYDSDYLVQKSQELDILIVQAVKEMNFAKKIFGDEFLTQANEFQSIIDRIKMFEKKYYSIRIVDPIMKEVLDLKKGEIYLSGFKCYKFLGKDGGCENCISKKSCKNDEILMKIEYFNDKFFLVISIPISIQDKKLSVELFKDISNSDFINFL